jgi:hypothetical protein
MGISAMVSTTTFTLAHWLFAEKYWLLSYKIPSMIDQSVQTPNLTFPKRVNVAMIFFTCLFAVVSTGFFLGLDLGDLADNFFNSLVLYTFVLA